MVSGETFRCSADGVTKATDVWLFPSDAMKDQSRYSLAQTRKDALTGFKNNVGPVVTPESDLCIVMT